MVPGWSPPPLWRSSLQQFIPLWDLCRTGGRPMQIQTGADQPFDPFWSSDGNSVYYWTNSTATHLWRLRLDGTGKPTLVTTPQTRVSPESM